MPPRQDDDTMVHMTDAAIPSPASRPTLFDLPKDISFLEIEQPLLLVDDSHTAAAASLVRQRMASSLEKATARADEIHQRLAQEDIQNRYPSVHEACRSALEDEMSRLLNQATMLEEDTKKEDVAVSQMTKNKRLSVALIHALLYLDALESAMSFSSRDRLEAGIRSVLQAVTEKCNDEGHLAKVFVSSWTAPWLAFDFQAGSAATLSIPAPSHQPLSLPMDLEVRPIIEYTADELIQSHALYADAFSVTVEKCTHELRAYGTSDGITGEAVIQVHIAPLAESKRKRHAVWGRNDGVEPIGIKEVRAIQLNSYPTKFRISFDMFTSTVYGESGVTLTLAMKTCETMDGKVPKVLIELVVDDCTEACY